MTPNLCAKLSIVFNDTQELGQKGNRRAARFIFMLVIQARLKMSLKSLYSNMFASEKLLEIILQILECPTWRIISTVH